MKPTIALAAAAFFALYAPDASAKVRSNTQIKLPNDLHLADMNGDKLDEWIVIDGRRLMLAETSYEARGMGYTRLGGRPLRAFTGAFTGSNREEVCVIQANDKLACYHYRARRLQRAWIEDNFIRADEEVIVGDFTGNGKDDLLLYTPSTGVVRLFRHKDTEFGKVFDSKVDFGDLGDAGLLTDREIYAGNFKDYPGEGTQVDLVVYNPAQQRLKRFDARKIDGKTTFRRVKTSAQDFVNNGEKVSVANVQGTKFENIILHKESAGRYRFFSGDLTKITRSRDFLPTSSGYDLFWGDFKQTTSNTLDENRRDDALLRFRATKYWITYHALASAGRKVYLAGHGQTVLHPNGDPDGDGIKTRFELGGYDTNNDGVSDAQLWKHGASPYVRDVFVEVDYMVKRRNGPTRDFRMSLEGQNIAIEAMAAHGINLHILQDNEVTHQRTLGDRDDRFNWERHFDPIKDEHFSRNRWKFFHYALFADRYWGSSSDRSSGQSRGIGASDFIVTLGAFDQTPEEEAGTFLHELGHNLGLRHGGTENTNYKPNHLSVMNYAFQFDGIKLNGSFEHRFSTLACNAMNEADLNERRGVKCTGENGNAYETWINGLNRWAPINTPQEFDGLADGDPVRADLNADPDDAPRTLEVLGASTMETSVMTFEVGLIGQEIPEGVSAVDDNGKRKHKKASKLVEKLLKKKPTPTRELDRDMLTEIRKHRPRQKKKSYAKYRKKIRQLQMLGEDKIKLNKGETLEKSRAKRPRPKDARVVD